MADRTLGRYRAEIGRCGLLTADEERSLSAAIRRGRRAAVVHVDPTDGESRLRVRAARDEADLARHRLVSANLAWVIRLARRMAHADAPLDDLLQAGATGLLIAAETYEPDRGRFTTYATFYVKDEIRRALEDNGPGLRVRLAVRREAALVAATRERLREVVGREPTCDELAASTGLTEAAIKRVEGAALISAPPRSLDSDVPAELMLEDPQAKVEQLVLAKARASAARRLLGELTEREAEVVSLRFGLDDGRERNRAEVGRVMQISRERVRQLEHQALGRLRDAADRSGVHDLVTSV